MSFDAKEYRARVLTPLKNQRLPQLQAGLRRLKGDPAAVLPTPLDLAELYDITDVVGDAQVAAQVAAVADTFNKCLSNASFKKIGPTLVELHKLVSARNPGLSTAAFWHARVAERSARGRSELADFVDVVAGEAVLGVITTTKLARLATDVGVSRRATEAEIKAALRERRVEVVAPVVKPPVDVPPAVLSELAKTSCASIVDAVFLDAAPRSFSVVDGFAGAGGERLTLERVRESRRTTEQRSSRDDENDAIRKALGALDRLKDDRELEQVVQACFIELGRRAAQTEPALALALRRLTDTRLDRRDAARILISFADEKRPPGFAEVDRDVAEGQLKAARRLYEALCAQAGDSVADGREQAGAALVNAEQRVSELRRQVEVALASGEVDVAARALDQARTICTDDEALADVVLPPPAPHNVVVDVGPDGRAVRLRWDPGPRTTPEVVYTVVRRPLSPPRDTHDGATLGSALTSTQYEDRTPDLAVELHYGVAAVRGDSCSPVVSQHLTVLPPVRDVQVTCDESSISLSWDWPSGARTVRVEQVDPAGRRTLLAPSRHGDIISPDLVTGATYTFVLTAVYATASGDLEAQPCRVTAMTRGAARPVPFITLVQRTTSTGEYELEATWKPVVGFPVELWCFSTAPWSYGSSVPMSVLAAQGRRLTGPRAGVAGREGLRAAVPSGIGHYVAVTRDGDMGVIGQCNRIGVCPRLTDVQVEPFHDVVRLSWQWPGEEFDVRASWEGRSGSGERMISRPQYIAEGGLRIAPGRGATRVRLRVMPLTPEAFWRSPDTVVEVPGAAPAVRYTTSWRRRPFRRPHEVTLAFTSDEAPVTVPVVVMAQAGQVMPYAQDSGVVLATRDLELTVAGAATLTVPVHDLGPHFWVRAFVRHGHEFRLVDPPAEQLRGA